MKKIVSILLCIALAATMLVSLAACGGSKSSKGQVYWLNFKPESNDALQAIAKKYTDEKGVKVTVVTAASGTYNETLIAEMDKSEAPTLFVVGNQAAVDQWADYCYDLKDTDLVKDLNTDAYNLYDANGKLCSVGYCYECFGIIVNKALLDKAGYKVEDITDFDSLTRIAEDIHFRAADLGFDAFTSSGMDDSSSWRFSGHLMNTALYYESVDDNWTQCPPEIKGTYVKNFRALWDLYTNNAAVPISSLATGGYDAEAEFGKGEAVFYQNGNWEFGNLTGNYGMNPEDLYMIPLYCGVDGEEKAGLNCGTENCWAVNAKAKEADIQATLEFMKWLVSDGSADAVATFGAMPYKNAAASENVFLNAANDYANKGCYTMTWAFNYTPNVDTWRAAVVAAMNKYDDGGDWGDVETAIVQGWATQYKAANE